MKTTAKSFDKLREHIESIPIIDCHDHSTECGPHYPDPMAFVTGGYFMSDLYSAFKPSETIQFSTAGIAERWPILEEAWKRTCHTGYAQVVKRVLKEFYNEDTLTLQTLERIADRLIDLTDESVFESILEKAGIVARLENVAYTDLHEIKAVLDGTFKMSPRARIVIPLWSKFHNTPTYESIQELARLRNTTVTSLDEYIALCKDIFQGFKRFGAVAFKDQCAYAHGLAFTNPTRHQAEEVFNWIMQNPRRQAGYPDQLAPLEDYLFHQFMRIARDMELPVQLHTGHLAGGWNDIRKANAALFANTLELHRDVQFDMLHANWPYDGELLFLAKSFPNVTINFSWTHIIDPLYCQNMLKQTLSAVPHGKIHGYGSDFGGNAEMAWAHASIARDNIAIALADMVEADYINYDEAKAIAHDWLFANPNRFFRLALDA